MFTAFTDFTMVKLELYRFTDLMIIFRPSYNHLMIIFIKALTLVLKFVINFYHSVHYLIYLITLHFPNSPSNLINSV